MSPAFEKHPALPRPAAPAEVDRGLLGAAGTVAGRGVGAVLGAVGRLRSGRALHPQGVALAGTLTRTPGPVPSGIAWLDTPGRDAVTGRLSRSAGLPTVLPDVLGLALRCPGEDGPVDLLLSATGLGRWTRWLLAPHRRVDGAALSTIIPWRGTAGPVLLAAVLHSDAASEQTWRATDPAVLARAHADAPLRVTLHHATPGGRWHAAGRAELERADTRGAVDTTTRYDAVAHPPPGAQHYAWTRRLREPAYAASRRGWPGPGPVQPDQPGPAQSDEPGTAGA